MTLPRQLLPGKTYFLTRRITQRRFFLRPCRLTNHLVEYCLAVAANATGVMLHAVCVMSNHWHAVASDPFARLPEFLERFHRLLARALNVVLARSENLWSSDKPSIIELVTDQDILDKMAYTLANPTAAGLVHSPNEWPGVITKTHNEVRKVSIPDVFFDENGEMPDELELRFQRPPAYLHRDDADFSRLLSDAVCARVRKARAQMAAEGRTFLGVAEVLRQPVDSAPETTQRKGASPRVSAAKLPERVAAIKRLKKFVADYREAWNLWRSGQRNVLFPAGTYALRIHAGVECVPIIPT